MSRIAVGAVGLLATAAVATAHSSGRGTQPAPYSLGARQAQEVAVTIRFINAFNAHKLEQALATFAPDAGGSDCSYRPVQVVRFRGKREIAAWLRKRFADDDRLGAGRVLNENAAQPVGVLAVEWAKRKSKTLRRLGVPQGIVPALGAKVIFTRGSSSPRIRVFSNGPGGADPNLCRPR
jgi:limonene-1,2-epoxide hydrolase